MTKNAWVTIIVIILIIIVGWAIYAAMGNNPANQYNQTPDTSTSGNTYNTDNTGSSNGGPGYVTSTTTVNSTTTVSTNATVKSFNVTARNYNFSPASITVKKGDAVKIVLTSAAGSHDFVIDEFNVHSKTVSPGNPDSFTFIATKAGTFHYYSSLDKTYQMLGTLVVQ